MSNYKEYAKTRIRSRKLDAWNSWRFLDIDRSPNPHRKSKLVLINKNSSICSQVDNAVPADDRYEIKEIEK